MLPRAVLFRTEKESEYRDIAQERNFVCDNVLFLIWSAGWWAGTPKDREGDTRHDNDVADGDHDITVSLLPPCVLLDILLPSMIENRFSGGMCTRSGEPT